MAKPRIQFICQACGHTDNADHNAARNIARRGAALMLSGGWSPKEKKRCSIRKVVPTQLQIGADCAESPAQPAKPVETKLRRGALASTAHSSTKQEWEAPASCQQ